MSDTPKKQVTTNDLAVRVDGLAGTVDGLAVTTNNLAVRMDSLAGTVDGLAVTIDDLALMIGRGFKEVKADMTDLSVGLNKKIDDLDKKVDRIDNRLTNQLDYVMLHYTRRSEHELLVKRVGKLERK